jgi:hypothetical protein
MDVQEITVLEILKRAKGISDGEIMPFGYKPPAGLQEELNQRTYKAGYTNKEGGPRGRTKIMAEPPNEQYRKNYDKIKWR